MRRPCSSLRVAACCLPLWIKTDRVPTIRSRSSGFVALQTAARTAVRPAISMKIEGMVGDCAPLGFFDPLGFSKDASPETMKKCVQPPARRGASTDAQ